MKIKRSPLTFLWFVLLALSMFMLAACDPTLPDASQIASGSGIRVWLDQPPDDAHLPLAPYTLRAHARDLTGGGVGQIVFLVNKIPLGTIPTDPTRPLVSAEFAWNPSVPGEYTVQAQASGQSGSALSEIAVVCVGPNCVQVITPTPTVTVTPAAQKPTGCSGTPVISFTASPVSVSAGGSVTLSWSVSNADLVEINDVGAVPATGTRSVSPTVSMTFTIAAFCGGKENMAVQSLTVAVTGGKACSGKPVISAFTASPTAITIGGSSTLQWSVTNADRVEMAGVGEVGATGSRVVSPRTTATYTLVAFCGGKENNAERAVSVTVAAVVVPRTPTRTPTRPAVQPPLPPAPAGCTGTPNISSFSASPANISAGQFSTLSWGAVTNADSVSIDQGIGGVGTPGSTTVSPGGTTIYTLTARCGSNTVTRQATVTVTAPPPQDKQGPTISSLAWNEKSVFYNADGCGPTSFTVSANVIDPSGVKLVQLTYRYLPSQGGASNPNGIPMNPVGGNNYSAMINVKNEAYSPLSGGKGQVEFWVVAQDGSGNSAQTSTATVSIDNCLK